MEKPLHRCCFVISARQQQSSLIGNPNDAHYLLWRAPVSNEETSV